MRKKAIIIGCSGSGTHYLSGVKKDVENYTNFLMSNCGGRWNRDEIIILLDDSKERIITILEQIKSQNYDFVFSVFTGHGDYHKEIGVRRLYTDNNSYIYETSFWNISKKELLIFDTCAGVAHEVFESTMKAANFAESREFVTRNYRKEYEDAIICCLNQQIRLYACDIDEFSSDTSKGGLYSINLLEVAYSNQRETVLNSLLAQEVTGNIVAKKSNNKQNPQYNCNVRFGSKLPISVKG